MDLLKKRVLRSALALTAASSLAGAVLVQGANAQTTTLSAISVTAAFSGPVPSGVSGLLATVACRPVAGVTGDQTQTAQFGTTGGTTSLSYALLAVGSTAAPLGSNCDITAQATGTANLTVGQASINIGGNTWTVGSTTGRPLTTGTASTGATTFKASNVPIDRATSITITMTYPSLIVRKVVNGDEPVAGFAYPMTIACSTSGTTVAPAGTAVFNGTFTLAAGASRTFGVNEFPALSPSSVCEVRETNSQGSALGYSSTVPATTVNGVSVAGTPLVGVLDSNGVFKSALTAANGQTITVTNTFAGDLWISKVVTGDPKTNIGVYEISVACDKGGPKETFTLRDRQTKVYTGIAGGTNCLVTETRSDGAVASYTDNSGDNTTDGRVTIRLRGPSADALGNPLPNTAASVIVTNSYVPPTTTAAPTTAAPVTAAPTTLAAPATTAAPAVAAAPAAEVESEPTFTG